MHLLTKTKSGPKSKPRPPDNVLGSVAMSELMRAWLLVFLCVMHVVAGGVAVVFVFFGMDIDDRFNEFLDLIGFKRSLLYQMIRYTGAGLVPYHAMAFFTCMGTLYTEKRSTIQYIFTFCIVVSVCAVAAAGGTLVLANNEIEAAGKSRGTVLGAEYREPLKARMREYKARVGVKATLDRLQFTHECCGNDDYKEWMAIQWYSDDSFSKDHPDVKEALRNGELILDDVPYSCCNRHILRPCIHHQLTDVKYKHYKYTYDADLTLYKSGCRVKLLEAYREELGKSAYMIIGFILGVEFVILIGTQYVKTSMMAAIATGDPEATADGYLIRTGKAPPPQKVEKKADLQDLMKLLPKQHRAMLLEMDEQDDDDDSSDSSDSNISQNNRLTAFLRRKLGKDQKKKDTASSSSGVAVDEQPSASVAVSAAGSKSPMSNATEKTFATNATKGTHFTTGSERSRKGPSTFGGAAAVAGGGGVTTTGGRTPATTTSGKGFIKRNFDTAPNRPTVTNRMTIHLPMKRIKPTRLVKVIEAISHLNPVGEKKMHISSPHATWATTKIIGPSKNTSTQPSTSTSGYTTTQPSTSTTTYTTTQPSTSTSAYTSTQASTSTSAYTNTQPSTSTSAYTNTQASTSTSQYANIQPSTSTSTYINVQPSTSTSAHTSEFARSEVGASAPSKAGVGFSGTTHGSKDDITSPTASPNSSQMQLLNQKKWTRFADKTGVHLPTSSENLEEMPEDADIYDDRPEDVPIYQESEVYNTFENDIPISRKSSGNERIYEEIPEDAHISEERPELHHTHENVGPVIPRKYVRKEHIYDEIPDDENMKVILHTSGSSSPPAAVTKGKHHAHGNIPHGNQVYLHQPSKQTERRRSSRQRMSVDSDYGYLQPVRLPSESSSRSGPSEAERGPKSRNIPHADHVYVNQPWKLSRPNKDTVGYFTMVGRTGKQNRRHRSPRQHKGVDSEPVYIQPDPLPSESSSRSSRSEAERGPKSRNIPYANHDYVNQPWKLSRPNKDTVGYFTMVGRTGKQNRRHRSPRQHKGVDSEPVYIQPDPLPSESSSRSGPSEAERGPKSRFSSYACKRGDQPGSAVAGGADSTAPAREGSYTGLSRQQPQSTEHIYASIVPQSPSIVPQSPSDLYRDVPGQSGRPETSKAPAVDGSYTGLSRQEPQSTEPIYASLVRQPPSTVPQPPSIVPQPPSNLQRGVPGQSGRPETSKAPAVKGSHTGLSRQKPQSTEPIYDYVVSRTPVKLHRERKVKATLDRLHARDIPQPPGTVLENTSAQPVRKLPPSLFAVNRPVVPLEKVESNKHWEKNKPHPAVYVNAPGVPQTPSFQPLPAKPSTQSHNDGYLQPVHLKKRGVSPNLSGLDNNPTTSGFISDRSKGSGQVHQRQVGNILSRESQGNKVSAHPSPSTAIRSQQNLQRNETPHTGGIPSRTHLTGSRTFNPDPQQRIPSRERVRDNTTPTRVGQVRSNVSTGTPPNVNPNNKAVSNRPENSSSNSRQDQRSASSSQLPLTVNPVGATSSVPISNTGTGPANIVRTQNTASKNIRPSESGLSSHKLSSESPRSTSSHEPSSQRERIRPGILTRPGLTVEATFVGGPNRKTATGESRHASRERPSKRGAGKREDVNFSQNETVNPNVV